MAGTTRQAGLAGLGLVGTGKDGQACQDRAVLSWVRHGKARQGEAGEVSLVAVSSGVVWRCAV